jgi:hypothetical protein
VKIEDIRTEVVEFAKGMEMKLLGNDAEEGLASVAKLR